MKETSFKKSTKNKVQYPAAWRNFKYTNAFYVHKFNINGRNSEVDQQLTIFRKKKGKLKQKEMGFRKIFFLYLFFHIPGGFIK